MFTEEIGISIGKERAIAHGRIGATTLPPPDMTDDGNGNLTPHFHETKTHAKVHINHISFIYKTVIPDSNWSFLSSLGISFMKFNLSTKAIPTYFDPALSPMTADFRATRNGCRFVNSVQYHFRNKIGARFSVGYNHVNKLKIKPTPINPVTVDMRPIWMYGIGIFYEL